ncbi:hypothetical protein HDU96_000121 [Phlyctochytrium bullatum]|nr:hypothetical protein HDU96_000121 [Phlyctochytrium bullatum]
MTSLSQRREVLRLYRSFLRLAKSLPTAERRTLIKKRVAHDFRQPLITTPRTSATQNQPETAPNSEDASAADPLSFRLALAHTQLDNLRHQVEHLQSLASMPSNNLFIPVDIYAKSGSGMKRKETWRDFVDKK